GGAGLPRGQTATRHERPQGESRTRRSRPQHGVWAHQRPYQDGSVTNHCAMTPWQQGVHSSRTRAHETLAGTHCTKYVDIEQVVKQSQSISIASMRATSSNPTLAGVATTCARACACR